MEETLLPARCTSADKPTLQGGVWVEQQWEIARLKTIAGDNERQEALLVLDDRGNTRNDSFDNIAAIL
jgi:hypothetical protein